jgi:hypothetical protein
MGIIDMLQEWNFSKKMERFFKVCVLGQDKDGAYYMLVCIIITFCICMFRLYFVCICISFVFRCWHSTAQRSTVPAQCRECGPVPVLCSAGSAAQ